MNDILNLKQSRVFFYPAAGEDWYWLAAFGGRNDQYRCDTFVYCDWCKPPDFADRLETIGDGNLEFVDRRQIHPADLGIDDAARPPDFLTPEERELYERAARDFPVLCGLATCANYMLITQGERRPLRLIYLGAEGVAAYLQLFQRLLTCPQVLCIVGPSGFGFNWTQFHRWNEPLGRAVRATPDSVPALILTDDRRGQQSRTLTADVQNLPDDVLIDTGDEWAGYDWPWSVLVEKFPARKVYAFSRAP